MISKRGFLNRFWKVILIAVLVLGLAGYGRSIEPIRRVTNEFFYRLPFHVPGLPVCPDCNIILVSLDTLRADDLPCYGYARDTAPNLCAFAQKNILFSRFYSQSATTLDSHMSIFTGLYPSTHHVLTLLKDELNPAIPTLTQILQKHGYQTIWAGVTDDPQLPLTKGLERGFSDIHTLVLSGPMWQKGYEELLPKFLSGKPTFMFLHTYAVHSPYLAGPPPRRYVSLPDSQLSLTDDQFFSVVNTVPFYWMMLGEFRNRLSASDTVESKKRNQELVNIFTNAVQTGNIDRARQAFWQLPSYELFTYLSTWYWQRANLKDKHTISYIQGLYDERINQLDDTLKPLLDFVSRPEIKRKTIIILTADHGEEFMEHGHMEHGGNLYKTATHVPFIAAIPGTRSGVQDSLAQSIDIYPTLLELVGIRPMKPLEGKSLVPTVLDPSRPMKNTYLVSEVGGNVIISIQNDRYKLYKNNFPKQIPYDELYDLLLDPNETHMVPPGSRPEVVDELSQALKRILDTSPKYEPLSGEFPAWIDNERRQHIIEHGYF